MTVIEAVLFVMRGTGVPMSPIQVLQAIESQKLYAFRARSPLGIIRSNMRRHSEGCPMGIAASTVYFRTTSKNTYSLLPSPIYRPAHGRHSTS